MSSDPFADEQDPFAGWSDEDEHAAHSGPEESDPFAEDEPEVIEGETADDENTPAKIDPEAFQSYITLTVLQRIINNAVADYTGARKVKTDELLPEASRQLGTDQWKVRVPTIDGREVHIGTVSVKRTKEKTEVSAEGTFIEWAETNFPDIVEVEEVPEKTVVTPAHTVKRVKASKLQDLIDAKGAVSDGDGGLVTKDGEPIPGVKHTEKDEYNGHLISFGGKGNPLEEAGLALLIRNQLSGYALGDIIQRTAIEKKDK